MRKPTLDKNLLSVALGNYLIKERAALINSKSKDVAAAIGISDSLYRMIEAGSARIHPKYILDFIKVFNASSIQFNAFAEIIFLIQFLDSFTDNANKYSGALNNLLTKTNKYIKILEPLEQLSLELQKSKPKNVEVLQAVIVEELKSFLSLGDLHSKTQSEIQESYPDTFFKDIPTNQVGIFEKIKEFVLTQPRTYSSATSWDWEKNNKTFFKNCFILDKQPEIITGLKNLSNYRYEYLWEANFEKTCILFISNETPEKHKDVFKKNLKKSFDNRSKQNDVEGQRAKERLITFDKIIDEKIEMKCISAESDKIEANKILKATESNNYNAAWVFSLSNFLNVGVRAILEGDEARLTQGDYLTFEETYTILKELEELWKRV
jgi:hypothetical protein